MSADAPKPVLFRLTYDETQHREETPKPRVFTTESFTELHRHLTSLMLKPERYSNIRKFIATVDWQEV